MQETFATSAPIRAACGESIFEHAARLTDDLRAAIEKYPPRKPVDAEGLATYIQVVIQGGFVLSKAKGDRTPLLEALEHLKQYFELLFDKKPRT